MKILNSDCRDGNLTLLFTRYWTTYSCHVPLSLGDFGMRPLVQVKLEIIILSGIRLESYLVELTNSRSLSCSYKTSLFVSTNITTCRIWLHLAQLNCLRIMCSSSWIQSTQFSRLYLARLKLVGSDLCEGWEKFHLKLSARRLFLGCLLAC